MVDLNKGATVELVKALSDDIRTLPDGTKAASAGAAVREQHVALSNLAKGKIENSFLSDSGWKLARCLNIQDGTLNSISNYHTTGWIKIPENTAAISHDFTVPSTGTAGWCIYDNTVNTLSANDQHDHFIIGGKSTEISVPENAGYIRFTFNQTNVSSASDIPTKNYSFYIGEYQNDINKRLEKMVGVSTVALDTVASKTYNITSGVAGTVAGYVGTELIDIPLGCQDIITNMTPNAAAGWCLYDSNRTYVVGGSTQHIPVNKYNEAKYVAFSGYKYEDTTYTATYYFGKMYDMSEKEPIVRVTPTMITGKYINSATGGIQNSANNTTLAVTREYITIPAGTKLIRHTAITNSNSAVGYAIVDETMQVLAVGVVDRDTGINIPSGAVAFAISDYDTESTHSIEIEFIRDELPFIDKIIAFDGDSITYGESPDSSSVRLDNPYPSRVGALLHAKQCINYGISSGSLMEGRTGGGSNTPHALVTDYVNISDDVDILGVMIGINDYTRQCINPSDYKDYPLGGMTDRTTDTFYGALHVFILGLLDKFKPIDKKHVFFMIYPFFDRSTVTSLYPLEWETYMDAVRTVCNYYAIPILDLEKEMGITQMADTTGVYWKINADETGTHNAHPKQAGADMIANTVANFINRRFAIN